MNYCEMQRNVTKFYKENQEKGKLFTIKHFKQLGESESSILHYLKLAERGSPIIGTKRILADTTNSRANAGRVVKKSPLLTSTPSSAQQTNYYVFVTPPATNQLAQLRMQATNDYEHNRNDDDDYEQQPRQKLWQETQNQPQFQPQFQTQYQAQNQNQLQHQQQPEQQPQYQQQQSQQQQQQQLLRQLQQSYLHDNLSNREKLLTTCRIRCGRLLEKFFSCDWILDSTALFTYRCNQPGRFRTYYTFDGDDRTPPVINSADTIPRLNVWIAFSSKGVSKPIFMPADEKMSSHTYKNQCVNEILIPFIKEVHEDLSNVVIWPDSTRTIKKVEKVFEKEKFKFVSAEDNPGSRVRCNSYFWSLLKNYVYEDNWIAENDEDLRERILFCLQQIDMDRVQAIVDDTEARIREMFETARIKMMSDTVKKYSHID